MVGILVQGDNHFIVRGPLPDRATALELVRHWSLIQIGAPTPPALDQWRIVTREFRENLEWAVPGDEDISLRSDSVAGRAFSTGVSPAIAIVSAPIEKSQPGR